MTATTEDFFAASTGGGEFLSASAAFTKVGDVIKGTIVEEPVLIDQTVFKTNEIKKDKKGNVLKQLVVVLQTEHRNWERALKPAKDAEGDPRPAGDDIGHRALFVKFKLRDAIADALKDAGAKNLEVGGELAVAYVGNSDFNGFDTKDWKAQYKKPSGGADIDFFGSDSSAPPF